MNSHHQAPPSGLLSLPPELRTIIYEYVYPADQRGHATDLTNVDSPSKNLLLTNKLIHHEAQPLYKRSFRNFWSQRDFVFDCRKFVPAQIVKCLRSIRDEDFNHITALTITYITTYCAIEVYTLVDYRGGWCIDSDHLGRVEETRFLRFRRSAMRNSPNFPPASREGRCPTDHYECEEELRAACKKYNNSNPPPLKPQVVHLLRIEDR